MEKIKTRWRKNYLEGDIDTSNNSNNNDHDHHHHHHHHHHHRSSKHSAPPQYEPLTENLYLDKRKNEHSRSRKDARSMVCDCILTKEERARGIMGCLDDCLNRMLMIECGPKCTLGDHCLNKRFQKCQSAKVEVFKTRKKGFGLRTTTELPANSFIMEYVGEVVRSKEFRSRVKKYTKQKIKHHYFMALRSDEIIDATVKGNLTRFINHSCEPNCETQKWTVNGDLRIGFFTIKALQPGDEITFDYQFQRYGRKAQKCYCEAPSCRGFIGGNEQTFSLNGNSSPQINENKAHKKSYKHGLLVDVTLEDKINALAEVAAQGLKTRDQVIALASLSIKAEEVGDRRKLLDIIKATKSEISLRLFVDYHGLEIICLWMRDPQADCEYKATIIDILEKLPIPNQTKVLESNVYRMIERWATEEPKVALQPTSEVNSNNTIGSQTNNNDTNENCDVGDELDKSQESIKSDKSNALTENHNTQQSTPKPQSPTKTTQTSNTLLPSQSINSPNIKALAGKLLKKFQALAPGFKIPRLNRLQRMEIEKKMDEEVIREDTASNDKLGFEHKNPFASRNYFKSNTINGLVSNSTTKINNVIASKRKFDSLSTNNIDLTPAPKISKEEHRQQFEMHVRLKDYYDTVEKHYGPAAVEQLRFSQRAFPPPINGLPLAPPCPPPQTPLTSQSYAYLGANHHLTTAIPPPILVAQAQQQPPTILSTAAAAAVATNSNQNPHLIYPGMAIDPESRYQQSLVVPPQASSASATNSYHLGPPISTNSQAEVNSVYQPNGRDYSNDSYHDFYTSHPKESEIDSIVANPTYNDFEIKATKPDPTDLPTLIVLANNSIEPAHAIDDELAFSICDYDEYYSIRDKPLSVEDVLDDLYPCPGSYYTTPNGETWFATVTLDRKSQQPRTVILNLQIRSDADQLQTAAPVNITKSPSNNQQSSITHGSYPNNNDEFLATSTATNVSISTTSNQQSQPIPPQAPSSTDTTTESPNANVKSDKMPGKIKKKMFEHGVSKFIKDALGDYYKPDCQIARITSKEDFVFLARKLTLAVLEKELNRKGGCERLECNKQVKRKVEDFVRIYMTKFGKLYTRHNKT